VYVDVTLTRSKVKVNLTGLLNFRQLAKPCMLAAMTAAPLRGFLVEKKGFGSKLRNDDITTTAMTGQMASSTRRTSDPYRTFRRSQKFLRDWRWLS